MKYVSTRGNSPAITFDAVITSGLAPDGGLYMPTEIPKYPLATIKGWKGLSYTELAFQIIKPFTGGYLSDADLKAVIEKSYTGFDDPKIAPLKKLGKDEYLLELFHGPTLAFKDFALQMLGNLLDYKLTRENEHVTIIGATSGDTGSAAIEGCRKSDRVKIFMLHPNNRTSPIQRRQMTTIDSPNVYNIALEGTFDDCQDMVKEMFNKPAFAGGKHLMAVNSINWIRIMAQIVYYFYAYLQLEPLPKSVAFSVPTGNFGDIFAGYVAYKMGLPINRLIVATNANDILHRFFAKNDYSKGTVKPSLSPSMDIQVSSNFERLLYDLHSSNGKAVAKLMDGFKKTNKLSVDPTVLTLARSIFTSYSCDDAQTVKTIKAVHTECNEIICPHTAAGVAAANGTAHDKNSPTIVLATAHPAKFIESMLKADVPIVKLPEKLKGIEDKPERFEVMPNDFYTVTEYINKNL
ncbi:MAG: threonine synthase [Proteobacteria bacterium]|nr:threonine synthase [Pseudomonadota bacterium]